MNSSSAPSPPAASPLADRSPVMLIVSAVVLLAHGPMLVRLGQRMWGTEHYSFFPLILAGSAAIFWQRYRAYVNQRAGAIWDAAFRSPGLWVLSVLLLGVSVAADSPWPAGISFLLALRASLNSLLTEELTRRLMPAWWFLWLAIPLPFNLDRHLILMMQLLATRLASGVLDLAGMRHSLSGVVIELPGKSFFVEEACSGIQSLFAAVSVTVFYSILGRRGGVRTVILALFGILWVLVANAARIITVTVLSTRYEIPIDQGWAHEATGAAVFVTAMLFIVSTDRLLLFLAPLRVQGAFERDGERGSTRRSRRRTLPSWWTMTAGITAAAIFAGLGFVQLRSSQARSNDLAFVLDRETELLNESSLPSEWNGWTRQAFTIIQRDRHDPNGQISRVWQYVRSGQSVSFSVDGPFSNWHDLGLCYKSQGWTVEEEIDHTQQTDGTTRYDYSELTQENDEGHHAYVAFTAFDQSGAGVSPPPFFRVGVGMRFPKASILVSRFTEGLLSAAPAAEQYQGVVYQTQGFVQSRSLLTDAERKIVLQLFQHLTSEVQSQFRQSARPADADDSNPGEG